MFGIRSCKVKELLECCVVVPPSKPRFQSAMGAGIHKTVEIFFSTTIQTLPAVGRACKP